MRYFLPFLHNQIYTTCFIYAYLCDFIMLHNHVFFMFNVKIYHIEFSILTQGFTWFIQENASTWCGLIQIVKPLLIFLCWDALLDCIITSMRSYYWKQWNIVKISLCGDAVFWLLLIWPSSLDSKSMPYNCYKKKKRAKENVTMHKEGKS